MRLCQLALSLSFVLAACGGASKPTPRTPEPTPDPIPSTKGPDCSAMVDHMLTLADRKPGDDDMMKQMADVVRGRCKADAWGDEIRSCFGTAQSEDELDGCADKLTPQQKESLKDAAEKFGEEHPGVEGSAPTSPPPPPAPGAAPPPASAPRPASTTRGGVKKNDKGGKKTEDPCQGGE